MKEMFSEYENTQNRKLDHYILQQQGPRKQHRYIYIYIYIYLFKSRKKIRKIIG